MPNEIRTKTTVKDIKVLDKATSGTAHVKNAFVRSKQSAEATQNPQNNSASEYATDHMESGAKNVADSAVHRLKNPQSKIKQNVNKAKDHFSEAKRNLPKQRKQAAQSARKTADNAKQTADALKGKADQAKKAAEQAKKAVTDAKRTLRQTRQAGKTIKTSAKSVKATGKGTVKTAKQSVKTAERSAKVAVKTAQRTAKTAQQTAKATAKAAKVAAQVSKAAAKAAVTATKVAVKGTIALIKAAIAAIKGIVAIIAAGGWVAVLIIVIICLIGLLLGSVFGIFFSGEDSAEPGGRSMPAVVQELGAEFYNKIEEIKSKNKHDVVIVDAMSINWPEVLSVYAVKINTDPDNPAEVATLDDNKVNKLREVLNDMVTLSHSAKTETQQRTATVTDSHGNESEVTEEVSVTTLTITFTHKSSDDMAAQYRFNHEQKRQMSELLSAEYADLWGSLLGAYSAGNGETGVPDGSRIPKDMFSWPIGEGFSITSHFGYRKDPFTGETKYHGGTDIGAPEGTPILAAADGDVTIANSTDSWGGGYGYYVKIRHNDTYSTLYAHCSRIAAVNGQEVKKGEIIGYVGTTGNSTGNHLHWEVYKDGVRTNPLDYFE